VAEIRGKGLMIGVELKREAKPLVKDLLALGIVANGTAGTVLRLVPPLVLTEAEADRAVAAISEVLL